MVIIAAISFVINGYFAIKYLPNINYKQQMSSFIIICSCAILPSISAYFLGTILVTKALYTLIIQLLLIIVCSGLIYLLLRRIGVLNNPQQISSMSDE
jgi:hypothetical protein